MEMRQLGAKRQKMKFNYSIPGAKRQTKSLTYLHLALRAKQRIAA
jgi:hypothetical protein